MKRRIEFYKKDDRWYANIPDHTEDENEMIDGSDNLLEQLAVGDKLVLYVGDEYNDNYLIKFALTVHDWDGAEYLMSGPYLDENDINGFTIWICNVTHDVFGEHPNVFYIYEIKQ